MKKPVLKTGNAAIRKAINAVADFAEYHGVHIGGRPGWVETPEGKHPPIISPPGVGETSPKWSLAITPDSAPTTVTVSVGTILKSPADLTDKYTIGNTSTEITPTAGHRVWIKVAAGDPLVVTIESGSSFHADDAAYLISGTGDTTEFDAYYYVLHEFFAASGTGRTLLTDGIYVKRLAADSDFLLFNTTFQKVDGRPVFVPMLMPYHGAVTAA
jgi:hypothetical protein